RPGGPRCDQRRPWLQRAGPERHLGMGRGAPPGGGLADTVRDDLHPGPATRRMMDRRRVVPLAIGVGLAAVYAAGAWLSGSLSPAARLPTLGGPGTAPPH